MSFVIGYARTPFTKINGALSEIPAVDLGAHAIKGAIAQAGITAEEVQMVFVGQVLQAGCGQNPARQSAVKAGIPLSTPAMTLNAVCLSGMEAISAAHKMIEAGEADIVVAAGQESMSQAPHVWVGSRKGKKFGNISLVDSMEFDGLTDAFELSSMGASTEKFIQTEKVSRQSQDQLAARSHNLSNTFRDYLAGEIAPFVISDRRGETSFAHDDGVRPETTVESLSQLRPAFSSTGTITAGNSSQLTDGAAAVILMSERQINSRNLKPHARIVSTAFVSGPDISLLAQPANAINTALNKISRQSSELSRVEINEAFAAVGVLSSSMLGLTESQVNVHGGAIALGHPIGASGTRIVGHLARQASEAPSGQLFAAGICGGGGQGSAVILESL